MGIPLRVPGYALSGALLSHDNFLAEGEGRKRHAKGMSEDGLGGFEDDFEVPCGAGGEDFGIYVGAAEGLASVFACEGEAHKFLDHLVVRAAGIRGGIIVLVVGAGRGSFGG